MLEHFLAFIFAALAGLVPTHSFSYVAPPSPLPPQQAVILFGGDMMFDRTIRTTAEEKGGDYLFSCLDPVLQGNDLVVANLEGPITGNPSQSVGSKVGSTDNFVFTFPLSTASLLAAHHIGIVNLGNNHIYNFGGDGVRATTAALTAAGVGYFGDPPEQRVATTSVKGIGFAFINYNQFADSSTASTTMAQIREATAAGELPVVFAHWGVEYATTSPQRAHELAHQFVDAGASLVVGSHPHVVEEHEQYRGADIYYSLGNLIFDQYWSDAVTHGLMLQVTFAKDGTHSIKEIPVVLQRDRRTCPVE
jgi:poly-gamma-glutamate capsule biosynthesis protein CapA/YwtB (metallophosphatase superfamily)